MELNFLEPPVDRLEVGGKEYEIDMTLDTCLRFSYLLEDKDVPDALKITQGLDLLLDDTLNHLSTEVRHRVLLALIEHVHGEAPEPLRDRKGNIVPRPKQDIVTDYLQDFDFIYAGFLQTYGIDLLENRFMDWRKFKALAKSLPKGTRYREVIEIRQMDASGLKGDDRTRLLEAKQAVALKEGR